MKLLLLCTLVALTFGHPALLEKEAELNSVPDTALLQEPLYSEGTSQDKKLGKRSFGWNAWPTYSVGWPILYGGHGWGHGGHGWSHGGWGHIGHGWLGGWASHGWPLILPSYGHGGWHGKW